MSFSASQQHQPPFKTTSTTSTTAATSTTTSSTTATTALTFEPITNENSHCLWEFLCIAAHEENIATVQSNPDLARYVTHFDSRKDFGWIATKMIMSRNKDNRNDVNSHQDNNRNTRNTSPYTPQPQPVGAIWARLWNDPNSQGFGFISETIPELALAVRHEYQGQGIGTALLQKMLNETTGSSRAQSSPSSKDEHQQEEDDDDVDDEDEPSERPVLPVVPGFCLSVRDSNPALRLYERFGFQKIQNVPNRVGSQSFTMLKLWDPSSSPPAPPATTTTL